MYMMKCEQLLKSGAALFLGILTAFSFGCLRSLAAYDTAELKTCTVEGGNRIVVTGTAAAGVLEQPAADGSTEGEIPDDGYYYLFELQPYETSIGSRTDYAAWSDKKENLEFSVPFSGSADDSRLYSRFVAALKIGNGYREISGPIYVTNPEAVASCTKDYPDAMSLLPRTMEHCPIHHTKDESTACYLLRHYPNDETRICHTKQHPGIGKRNQYPSSSYHQRKQTSFQELYYDLLPHGRLHSTNRHH